MANVEKVSFTVRRPTPVSRASSSGVESDGNFKVPLPRYTARANGSAHGSPLARSTTSSPAPRHGDSDSSDAEREDGTDELVTSFDRFGARRLHQEKRRAPSGPLIIPALKNRDWREIARKRKTASQYVPSSAAAQTGVDGSVGGLGTRDTINSGSALSGLQLKTMPKEEEGVEKKMELDEKPSAQVAKEEDFDDDEEKRALRAIFAGVDRELQNGLFIDTIPAPITEAEAYKQDVDELPDSSTLADYERVPVSQFGAALLRGMGWKDGTAATRQPGKGLVEPYLPQARPALLGIGAKEQDLIGDGSKKNNRTKKPEKRYVPVVKKERDDGYSKRDRERSRSPRSRNSSRRSSRSREHGDYDDRKGNNSERDYRRSDYNRDRSRRNRGEETQDRSREPHRRRD